MISRLLAFVVLLIAPPLFATPAHWAKDVDQLTANDVTHPPAPDGIVFVGSSSIVKWTSLHQDFAGENVIQRGFGGSELADSVYYANRVVIPYHPRAIVLYAGDNDLAAHKTPEQVFGDFQAFINRVHAALPGARIVYIAAKPSPSRWALHRQYEQLNALIAAGCAREPGGLRFVDVWQPMLNAAGEPRLELFVADRLHMNAAGYALWTPLVKAALK